MANKALLFGDEGILKKIMNTTNVRKIKALGREVRHFKNKTWNQKKFLIVATGNYLKFSQDPDLKQRVSPSSCY